MKKPEFTSTEGKKCGPIGTGQGKPAKPATLYLWKLPNAGPDCLPEPR